MPAMPPGVTRNERSRARLRALVSHPGGSSLKHRHADRNDGEVTTLPRAQRQRRTVTGRTGGQLVSLAAALLLAGCGAIATPDRGTTAMPPQGQQAVDACADAADRLERAHLGPGGRTFALRLVPDAPRSGDQVALRGTDVTPGMNTLVASYYLQDYPPDSGVRLIPDIVIADVSVGADGEMTTTFAMPTFRSGTCVLIHAIPAGQRPFEGAIARPFLVSR